MERKKQTVKIKGRVWPILERVRFASRTLLVIERLSSRQSGRSRVWDPLARAERVLVRLPRDQGSFQHLEVLRRVVDHNPNFPQILEFHRIDGELWVLLTWIDGISLAHYQKARPTRSNPADAFRITRSLAHAVCQLHRRSRCIHGDLKPTNILLSRKSNQVALVDFGSAWAKERTAYRQAGDGVSDGYAAPEQYVEGALVDARTDQFAVSAIAFELFTGELPYEGLGGRAGLPNYRSECEGKLLLPSAKTAMPRQLSPEVWQRIDRLIQRGLAFDLEARFPAQEWLDAIEEIHAQIRQPVSLRPGDQWIVRTLAWLGGWFRPRSQGDEATP